MIRYSLVCEKRHDFEIWFKNSADYDKQSKRGLVTCPECGSAKVEKALEQRQKGNELFKNGQLPQALIEYHHVLLALKGLEGELQAFAGPAPPINEAESSSSKGGPSARPCRLPPLPTLLTHLMQTSRRRTTSAHKLLKACSLRTSTWQPSSSSSKSGHVRSTPP